MYFCSVCNKTYTDIEIAMKCCTELDKDWFTLEETLKILNIDPKEILEMLNKEE